MIDTRYLIKSLNEKGINFFCGVPDSVLKNISNILENYKDSNHIVASNEGSAVGIGAGYYLSKKKIPAIYMQNSGLGNAINPLTSICHPKVYSIPMLLIIGWRGAPKVKDEAQHQVMGKITRNLLKLINVKFCILSQKKDFKKLFKLINYSKKKSCPVACIIKNKTLDKVKKRTKYKKKNLGLKRIDFISELLSNLKKKDRIIATTGYTSRELFQLRQLKKKNKGKDFYMVGGMGHTSSVSLGFALSSKRCRTICLDGDGSLLMHMGALGSAGLYGKSNFKYILLNNGTHESVGGQKTISGEINFKKLAKNLNFKNYYYVKKKSSIKIKLNNFLKIKGPSFLEVKIEEGTIQNLVRPKSLINIKKSFIKK